MRKHLLAVACLASLGLASSASATTILQFTQQNVGTDFVTATTSGGVTTMTTDSPTTPGFIPVNLTNLAGITGPGGNSTGFEQFTNVKSTGTATTAGGQITQTYSGTISFYGAVAGGAGVPASLFLQAAFGVGNFNGPTGGSSATLNGSQPPDTVTFTSAFPAIQALITGSASRAIALGFSNIFPALGTTGTALNGFSANNAGTFSTGAIPEPATLISSGMALLVGLGCYGWRRRK